MSATESKMTPTAVAELVAQRVAELHTGHFDSIRSAIDGLYGELETAKAERAALHHLLVQVLSKLLEPGAAPVAQRATQGRPAAPAADGTPMCRDHQEPMKPSQYGGFYCTAKYEDGTYCKRKVKGASPPAQPINDYDDGEFPF